MKKLILILLIGSLISQSAFDKYIKPAININKLVERDAILYTKDTNEPYTGAVFALYPSGKKRGEGYLKSGIINGKATSYYENGQLWRKENYKDGKKDGKWTYYKENRRISQVEYKNDKSVKRIK